MNPEKYQRAKEIFWQARDLEPAELEDYLETASKGDADLISEVHRLLAAARNTPDSFLEPTGNEIQIAAMEPGLELGHYRILGQIGKGGMGEVYNAEDLSLKREVALKVLPADLAADPHRLERFQREAEAVAALNHPNIVTIYSIEKDEDTRFLTMELVEGKSLDHALHGSGLPLSKVIKIGTALADALAAAHEKGIVHRDLKPSNVMLAKHGDVKVLDFGLAKMSRTAAPDEAEGVTQLATLTREGVVVGTAAYMSPEQAQGTAVDTRSDIFSFGCLLYETATGHRPFQGSSTIDVLHNIIHAEPAPPTEWLPEAPMQLQWILRKCLAKAPEDRYQAAADLAVDLRGLGRDLASDSALASLTSNPAAATPSSQSSESRSGRLVAVAVAVAVVAIGVLIWTSTRQEGGAPGPQEGPKTISIERLTSSGKVTGAAISPDGNYFVYSLTEEAQGQSLAIQQIARGQSLELVPRQQASYWSLGFTPDGSEVIFAQKNRRKATDSIFRVSTLGGNSQRVAEVDVDSQIGISPDGTRMAWFRIQHPGPEESSLIIANTDGTDIRPLVTLERPDYFVPVFFSGPSWSPDGNLLTGSVNTTQAGEWPRIDVYDSSTGAVEWSKELDFAGISHTCWQREGDGILVIAYRHSRDDSQIWLVPYPEGPPRRITNDLLIYRMLTLTADGTSLLTVAADPTDTMWVTSRDATATPQPISLGRRDGLYGFSFTPDGRLVIPVARAGSFQLAILNLEGSDQIHLTSGPEDDIWPEATPDGKVVYVAQSPSDSQLRRIDLDGGDQVTLVTAKEDVRPDVSHDGEWVVYQDPSVTGFPTLWRVRVAGGTPEQLTTYEAERVAISSDSSKIAFYYREFVDDDWKIGTAPLTGGPPESSFDGASRFASSFLRWTDDGQALLVNSAPGDRSNLYRLPLDGGGIIKITEYTEPRFSWVDFSPDGETMVFSRTNWSRDAILIEDFR